MKGEVKGRGSEMNEIANKVTADSQPTQQKKTTDQETKLGKVAKILVRFWSALAKCKLAVFLSTKLSLTTDVTYSVSQANIGFGKFLLNAQFVS